MMVGLGIDLVEVAAFEAELEAAGAGGLERRFTAAELSYCRAKRKAGEHLAARHAAKRAALKALGIDPGDVQLMSELEVQRAASGQPRLEISGALRARVDAMGIARLHLSISHSGGYAVGMVVAEKLEPADSGPAGNTGTAR